MIDAEITEDDYCIAGSLTAWAGHGEYGPLPCGCCFVALAFDPAGPSLVLLMQRKDADLHSHTLEDFLRIVAR